MRCPYCGSKMFYPDVNHKQFSGGKAIAGALAFGVVGAAAGFIGKDIKGYRCSACGMFSESAMEYSLESAIDSAIFEAQQLSDFSMYNELKPKYPNIETVSMPERTGQKERANAEIPNSPVNVETQKDEKESQPMKIKRAYFNSEYKAGTPVWVKSVVIKETDAEDIAVLELWNVGRKELRSVYFKVSVYDDAGDFISENTSAYQAVGILPGEKFPEREFGLGTTMAYKVVVEFEKAVFSDDEVWRSSEEETIKLSEQVEITADNFPKERYLRALLVEKSKYDFPMLYQPIFGEKYSQCICGMPVDNDATCVKCGLEIGYVAECLSFEKIEEKQKKTIVSLAKKRAQKLTKLVEDVREKLALQMEEKYNQAITWLSESETVCEIDGAIQNFEEVRGFKDSEEKLKECLKKREILAQKEKEDEARRKEERRKREEERKRLLEEKRKKEAEERRAAEEKNAREKRKKRIITLSIIAAIAIVVVLIVKLPNYIEYKPLRDAFNNNQVTAAYIQKNYPDLQCDKGALQVFEKELEKCHQQDDLKRALELLTILAESDVIFDRLEYNDNGNKPTYSSPHISAWKSFTEWMYEHARNGKSIRTTYKYGHVDESYDLYGYKVGVRINSVGEVEGASVYMPSDGNVRWYDIDSNVKTSSNKTIHAQRGGVMVD